MTIDSGIIFGESRKLIGTSETSIWSPGTINYTFLTALPNYYFLITSSFTDPLIANVPAPWLLLSDVDAGPNVSLGALATSTFATFTDLQKHAVRFLLDDTTKINATTNPSFYQQVEYRVSFPDVVNRDFAETPQVPPVNLPIGVVTFLNANLVDRDSQKLFGSAFPPDPDCVELEEPFSGDVFIDNSKPFASDARLTFGGTAFYGLMHELMHSIGALKDIKSLPSFDKIYDSNQLVIGGLFSLEGAEDKGCL